MKDEPRQLCFGPDLCFQQLRLAGKACCRRRRPELYEGITQDEWLRLKQAGEIDTEGNWASETPKESVAAPAMSLPDEP